MDLFAIVLVFGLIIWWTIHFHSKDLGSLDSVRENADECLRQIKVSATGSGYSFDGSKVEVLDRDEEVMWFNQSFIIGYRCSFLVRSQDGEYFLVIYRHDSKPYVKHTAHQIARAKLKHKYISPESAA